MHIEERKYLVAYSMNYYESLSGHAQSTLYSFRLLPPQSASITCENPTNCATIIDVPILFSIPL